MGVGVLRCSMLLLFYPFLISDSTAAEKPPWGVTLKSQKLNNQENRIITFSNFISHLDSTPGSTPMANPATSTIITPVVNTPISPPAAPIVTYPQDPPPAATTIPIIPNPPPAATTIPIIPNPPPAASAAPILPNPPPPATTTPIITNPPPVTTTTPSGGAWCIASPTASETALQVALDYACGYGGADCSAIQPGAMCYNPNTVRDHASYAFNQFYQKNPVPTSCAFGGVAQLTYTDPSSGSCRYASPGTTTSTSPPINPTPTTPSAPTFDSTTPSAPTFDGTTPSAPTVYGIMPNSPISYGLQPTAMPSKADSISSNLLLLYTTTCLIVSLIRANHF